MKSVVDSWGWVSDQGLNHYQGPGGRLQPVQEPVGLVESRSVPGRGRGANHHDIPFQQSRCASVCHLTVRDELLLCFEVTRVLSQCPTRGEPRTQSSPADLIAPYLTTGIDQRPWAHGGGVTVFFTPPPSNATEIGAGVQAFTRRLRDPKIPGLVQT